jgi:RNA polymerase sigma-70 factor (ECF subfamily)
MNDELYQTATQEYGAALERLARAYELDVDKCRDLLQEIHFELWRSFNAYEKRCSLRTWVYRVAHNTAVSYVVRQQRSNLRNLATLEEVESAPDPSYDKRGSEDRLILDQLYGFIHELKPLDRQLMLLYLEDTDMQSIAEITGLTSGAVRTQIHRIKKILTRRFHGGGSQ